MITDDLKFDEWYTEAKVSVSKEEAKMIWLSGLIYERRASAKLAMNIYDATAHAVGRLIRERGRASNRHYYE